VVRVGELVLRPGRDGVVLVPDPARPRAFTLRVGGTDQSYVDLDDPLRLEFDYVQRIADVVEAGFAAGERLRTVHVGGAGMTLPRYLAATRPQSAQVVLEPDTELTAFVREQLPLPRTSGIKVRAADGRSGVAALRDRFAELLVVDAFVGARVPAELGTVEFLADAHRVLEPSGVLALNLTDKGPFGYTRRVLAGLRRTFAHTVLCAEPSTIKGRRFGNVVLVGSDRALPVADLAARTGRAPFPYRVLHGDRLVQLVGSAAPWTDEDASASPEPPADLLRLG
jgi:spermidine synthase